MTTPRRSSHATLDHVDTHDPAAGLQTRQGPPRLFVELEFPWTLFAACSRLISPVISC